VRDKSIGGSATFNRFDGLLMALKDHAAAGSPKPPAEYFYSWWNPDTTDPQRVGQLPNFRGRWGIDANGQRDAEDIANWDAVTKIDGTTNRDSLSGAFSPDVGYTVEMRFNLTPMGYDVTDADGDVIEWNISIYDCDYFWALNVAKFSSNRTWWQSPWGNAMWFDEVHVYSRPDVTVYTTDIPTLQPELRVPNGAAYAAPAIDGLLTDPVWAQVPSFDIRYGDDALRSTYPGVGPYRSGQFQPLVNGGQAAIVDPGDATVKLFFRDDTLYLGFDVRDQVVQYHANFDSWDGFIVTMNDRVVRGPDNQLIGRRITFQVGPTGAALAQDYLPSMLDSAKAKVGLQMKPGTTLDTLGLTADTGYTAELAIVLTKMGYPAGRGDGSLFLGIDHMDGDSFTPFTDSYGSRVWWFREFEGQCCNVWAYMDPAYGLTAVGDPDTGSPPTYVLLGAGPTPVARGQSITVRYAMPEAGRVTLSAFDVNGRLIDSRAFGEVPAGSHGASIAPRAWSSGVVLYRLVVTDPVTGAQKAALSGRTLVLE
jgi:hypothetical protein